MSEMKLTDADLARLEELAGKATPGPWNGSGSASCGYGWVEIPGNNTTGSERQASLGQYRGADADARYIAAACNAAPALVAEVRRLRDRVEALEKTKKHLSETARVLAEQVGKGNLGKIQDALNYAHYKASEREAMK